jgi:hypothetical protein
MPHRNQHIHLHKARRGILYQWRPITEKALFEGEMYKTLRIHSRGWSPVAKWKKQVGSGKTSNITLVFKGLRFFAHTFFDL